MKKIKVLHVADKFGIRGARMHGVTRLFSCWMPRFDQKRFEVKLYGLRTPNEDSEYLSSIGFPVQHLHKGKFDFTTYETLAKVVTGEKADIIHLHGYGASNFGRMIKKRTGVKVIVHEHFVDPCVPVYQRPFDYVLRDVSDMNIAVCKAVRDFMVNGRYMRAEKTRVILNGIAREDFKQLGADEKKSAREKLGVSEHAAIISIIGRLDKQKGVSFFIQAAAEVLKRGYTCHFLVIGDGEMMSHLMALCSELGIVDRVHFLGYQQDVSYYQAITDIQVIPSLWEGVPLTVFEAMHMALPIIATAVDGLKEVLSDRENALIVEPCNASAIADSVCELLANRDLAMRLARNAAESAAPYCIQRAVEEMEKIYEDVCV